MPQNNGEAQGLCCSVSGCNFGMKRKLYAQRSARALFHGI